MIRKTIRTAIFFTCLLVAYPQQMKADLIGDTVEFDRFVNGQSDGQFQSSVVGDGIEFTDSDFFGTTFLEVDIGANTFEFNWIQQIFYGTISNPPIFYLISDLDWVNEPASITGVNVSFGGGTPGGFNSNNVTFGDDWVAVTVGDMEFVQGFAQGAFINVELETSHDGQIPEPTTLTIWSLGIVGLTLLRRRQLNF